MAITISSPAAGGPIGPGYQVEVINSVGPVPVDDYVVAIVEDGTGETLTVGAMIDTSGSLAPIVMVGTLIVTDSGANQRGLTNYLNREVMKRSAALAGAACVLTVVWRHHGGVLVDSTSQAMVWDPVGGLGNLMLRLTGADMVANGGLAAAVIRQFPSLP